MNYNNSIRRTTYGKVRECNISKSNRNRITLRKEQLNMHKLFGLIGVFFLLICCILVLKNKSYAAGEASNRTLCYRQIHVDEGDSLWSIASENYTEEWKNTKTYVKAIKEFNDLNTYEVYAGSYISIPYYTLVEE